ncbi:MAG: MBL fold metallo-hydrolase, partial [Sciscionella sp.]
MDGRWVEVGDGVLVRRYTELDLSVGLVVGGERCLVVDTRGDSAQGAELAAAVCEVTSLPWTVMITHAHFDHCFGTSAFLPTTVWAHQRCATDLAENGLLQREIWAEQYRAQGEEDTAWRIATAPIVLPSSLVVDSAELGLGGRTVELAHLGRGHTDHDLVLRVRDADVVFAGDLVEHGAPPAFEDSFPLEWPDTVARMLEPDAGTVVPGHGDPVPEGFARTQHGELAGVHRPPLGPDGAGAGQHVDQGVEVGPPRQVHLGAGQD